VDESVSRFISRLHEQIRSLTERLHTVEREKSNAEQRLAMLNDLNIRQRLELALTPWLDDDECADVARLIIREPESAYDRLNAAALTQQRDRYAAALREHAKPLGEWDMLWVAPDGTMPGRVADAHWARAHIDALLAALEENDE
jgi:hypothetical protein